MSTPHLLAVAGLYTTSSGRIGANVADVVALISLFLGVRGLARSGDRTGSGRRGATVSVMLGLIGMVIGGLVVATAEGGLGSGNGVGGGVVALVLGPIGMIIGGLALVRSRRAG